MAEASIRSFLVPIPCFSSMKFVLVLSEQSFEFQFPDSSIMCLEGILLSITGQLFIKRTVDAFGRVLCEGATLYNCYAPFYFSKKRATILLSLMDSQNQKCLNSFWQKRYLLHFHIFVPFRC